MLLLYTDDGALDSALKAVGRRGLHPSRVLRCLYEIGLTLLNSSRRMPMMISEMTETALRPVPSRFKRASKRASVEALMQEIGELTSERQRLRDLSAAPSKLERNRIRLARKQWELSHALIQRYLPADQSCAA